MTFTDPKQFDKTYLSFSLKASIIGISDCNYDCSSNSFCSNSYCICDSGYFDESCSTDLPIIRIIDSIDLYVPTKSYAHFAVSVKNRTRVDLRLDVSTDGYVHAYTYFNLNDDWALPSSFNYDQTYPALEAGTSRITLKNDIQYISYIIIGFYNDASFDQTIHASFPVIDGGLKDNSYLLVILWIVLAMVGIFLLVAACIFARSRSQRVQSELPAQRAGHILDPEEIEEYFPKKPFKQEFSEFEQNICSICLDEFEPQSICRNVLPCSHLFHQECIDSWLKSKTTCPNCNSVLDREKIKKFIQEGGVANRVRTKQSDHKRMTSTETLLNNRSIVDITAREIRLDQIAPPSDNRSQLDITARGDTRIEGIIPVSDNTRILSH